MMMKLRPKRFSIRFGCRGMGSGSSNNVKGQEQRGCNNGGGRINSEIKWELRPGGMLVQKRDDQSGSEPLISIRVSTVSQLCHHISIEATSTFGELKMVLSLVTGLEPREQRLLFKGKEREDNEFLHMVGVGDKDKVVVLQDPAIKEMKLQGIGQTASCQTISV